MKVFELLSAKGPDPGLGEDGLLYAPLIGSWDVVHRTLRETGVVERKGEWHFAWILGGRGVQDVLFAEGAPAGAYNTALRCYDQRIGAWRVTAMQSTGDEFVSLVARRQGERIVQEGAAHDNSTLQRWTFSNLTSDSFVWQGESSSDSGETWHLDQQMECRRRSG